MTNTQLTAVRTGATALITALSVLYTLYPHYIWITVIIAAMGAVGIHAIPAIQQGSTTVVPTTVVTTGGSTMSETQPETTTEEVAPEVAPQHNPNKPLDGLALMGLRAPVTDDGQEAATAVAGPSNVPVPGDGVAAPTVPVENVTAAPTATPVGTAPVTPSELRALADFLENL